jgi:hypothetical protein
MTGVLAVGAFQGLCATRGAMKEVEAVSPATIGT